MKPFRTILLTAILTLAVAGGVAYLTGWLHFGGGPSTGSGPGGKKLLFYRNPMDPTITSPVPAKDWMGMDYIPVYEGDSEKPRTNEAEDFFAETGRAPGRADVAVPEEQRKLAGVATAPAIRGALGRAVRAAGLVAADETRVRQVQAKTMGYVEKLFVNFMGAKVAAGQPVLSLYGPDLYTAQEEYLRAREAAPGMSPDTAGRLVVSAKKRLQFFDVPDAFIAELEKSGVPVKAVPIAAPFSGFVTGKTVFEGQKVEAGQVLFTVADLSTVWVEAQIFESESGAIKVGQRAQITLAGVPGETRPGTVSFVSPVLDPGTRTVTARIAVENPGLALKPGMFAEVSLSLAPAEGVLVPAGAVLSTGTRDLVYVEREAGLFTPREVKVGPRGGGMALILAGVEEGEKVATRAAFLLDSESQVGAASLAAAKRASAAAKATADKQAKAETAGPSTGSGSGKTAR
jgi:Cu(I)/Ag(I) efflux system membrane fusion protein